jgi:hypothetical protein
MYSFFKFGGMTSFLTLVLTKITIRNEVMMDQLNPFHKPNKKVRSEKMMN